jgi:hypothetical protein
MSSIGLNVDRSGRHDPALIRGLGATWIRIVTLPDLDLSDYFRRCRSAGLKILLVLARESGGDYAALAARYATLVDAWQIGNEADHVSPSSWTMQPSELAALGRSARAILPRPHVLVCAGMASGHPEWMAGMDLSWADAVACHPYAKDAPSAGDIEDLPDADVLIRAYGDQANLPVLVTEWGWWSDDEPRASEEVRDMVGWAGRTADCEVLFYFCTDDQMVPPFGLLRSDGAEKPKARAFKEQSALAIHSLWPMVQPEPGPEPEKPDPWRWWDVGAIAATTQCPVASVRAHWPRLVEQLYHCGIYELRIAAAMLGTVAIETAHRFEPIHEFRNADGSIPDVWWTYDGGPEYHGRGFIQLTHRSNYARYSVAISELWGTETVPDPQLDLVAVPDRALDPDISAAVSALYFRDHGNGAIPVAARNGDWREVRRLVQGGSAGLVDFTRYANALVASSWPDTPDPPVDPDPPSPPTDDVKAGYELALKTLRDKTIPDLEAQVKELRRIVEQFVGVA